MYHLLLFIGFLFVFFVICMVVYIAVVRAYYWGDKKEPPTLSRQTRLRIVTDKTTFALLTPDRRTFEADTHVHSRRPGTWVRYSKRSRRGLISRSEIESETLMTLGANWSPRAVVARTYVEPEATLSNRNSPKAFVKARTRPPFACISWTVALRTGRPLASITRPPTLTFEAVGASSSIVADEYVAASDARVHRLFPS